MPHRLPAIALMLLVVFTGSACGEKELPAPPAPKVVVTSVEKRDVDVHTEWVGTTAGFVNADIHPKIDGYVLKQVYHDGGVVKTGDLLFEIDPRQFQADLDRAKGQLARTQAILTRNELDVKRYKPLAAEGAVSQKELDDAVQTLAANEAQLASDQAVLEQARLNLAWTKVESPIDGVAGIANAQVGDLVGPTTLLTSVSQLDPIKVIIQLSEIEYLRFAKRVRAVEQTGAASKKARIELILADRSRYPEPGRASVAGLDVAATTGTIEVQGIFPNPDNVLRPGQFAKVRTVTQELPGALVIPQRAVRDLQGIDQVAVVGADDKVAFVNVKLGPLTGSDTVVTEGLKAGDRVVVEGLQKIRDGLVVEPVTEKAAAATKTGTATETKSKTVPGAGSKTPEAASGPQAETAK